jgi:uncharacterized protein
VLRLKYGFLRFFLIERDILDDLTTIAMIIFLYSIVQSVFGVGLLVFGTPTLLLLGYPFQEALLCLLPSSLAISILQVVEDRRFLEQFAKKFCIWCLIPMIVGLQLALTVLPKLHLHLIVGIILFLGASLRISGRLRQNLKTWLKRFEQIYLFLMGLVHGVSNLGGGLLTVYAGGLFERKESVRVHIALGYGIFAFTQLSVLFLVNKVRFGGEKLIFPVIAAAVFIVIGRWFFNLATPRVFYHGMTLLMLLFGTSLILAAL